MTASGVVFVDGHYWMDGEHFILQLPKPTKMSAMLCAVTYWQPVASDLFVVSTTRDPLTVLRRGFRPLTARSGLGFLNAGRLPFVDKTHQGL